MTIGVGVGLGVGVLSAAKRCEADVIFARPSKPEANNKNETKNEIERTIVFVEGACTISYNK